MSLCIRPVKETWGESVTYSGRQTGIENILEAICEYAEEGRGLNNDALVYETHDYGDMTVVFISDGEAFLSYLCATDADVIMDRLANDDHTSSDDNEYARQVDDIKTLKAVAPIWRLSIDTDKALRIYCDQEPCRSTSQSAPAVRSREPGKREFMKLECKEHKKRFKGGQGLAAHMRAFHPGGSGKPKTIRVAPKGGGAPPKPAENEHLFTALDILDADIGIQFGVLQKLKRRRELIAQALDTK